jgi:hypothetical protein
MLSVQLVSPVTSRASSLRRIGLTDELAGRSSVTEVSAVTAPSPCSAADAAGTAFTMFW